MGTHGHRDISKYVYEIVERMKKYHTNINLGNLS